MNIKVTTTKVKIEDESLNKGEYNIRECNFDLAEEFTGLVCKALFTVGKTKLTYEQSIVNNKCSIPYEATEYRGKVEVGVIAYEVEDEELIKRYSPEPDEFFVLDGSYVEDIENQSAPTPSELEQLEQRVSAIEIDAEQVEINTQDISDIKQEQTTQNNNILLRSLITETGSQIELSLNSTNFKMTATLKDKNGNVVNTSNEIDLPLESVIVNASYDSTTKELVLTLQNGTTVRVSIADLVSGLVSDTDYATNNKYGVVKGNTWYGSSIDNGTIKGVDVSYLQYQERGSQFIIDKGTLENVIIGKQLVNETQLNTKADKSSLVTGTGENITLQNTAELEFIQPPLPRGNSEQATVILPTGYTQLDYIESTGTQYIDTGITADENIAIESELKILSASNEMDYSGTVYGNFEGWCAFGGYGQGKLVSYFSTGSRQGVEINFDNNFHKYILKNGLQQIDNNSANNTVTTMPSSLGKIEVYLFKGHTGYAQEFVGKQAIKYCKIWKSNVLMRDYVPCKNANNEVGLYDLVSSTFFGNSGTGTFTAGNTVTVPNPSYPQAISNVTGDVEVLVQNKNLFDDSVKNNMWVSVEGNILTNSEGSNIKKINCSEGDSYTLSATFQNAHINNILIIAFFDKNNRMLGRNAINNNTSLSLTKTAPANTAYMYAGHYIIAPTTIQLEQGTTATTYTPHKEQTLPLTLGNIELCKIGTAQDYFYKENNKWYLYKAIGKLILNGSEEWNVWNLSSETNQRFYLNLDVSKASLTDNVGTMLCNRFQIVRSTSADIEHYTFSATASHYSQPLIIINRSRLSTVDVAGFKAWLSSNNVIVYYQLETPTITEITDTTLIEQLDSISNVLSYEEQTNISGSSDESNPLFEVQAVQYKEPDYWTIAYVNGQIGNAIGGAY